MSDNWVGPGWWMASDGKWYPPRESVKDDPTEPTEATRWSRRTPEGNPVDGATVLSSAENHAERAATRAERAAQIPRPEPVSIRRPEDIAEDIDLRENEENVDFQENIDLSENIDLQENIDPPADIGLPEHIDLRDSAQLGDISAGSDTSEQSEFDMAGHMSQRVAYVDEGTTKPSVDRNFSSSGRSNGSIRTDSDAEQESMEPNDQSSSEQTPNTGELVHHEEHFGANDQTEAEDRGDAPFTPGPAPLQHAILPALVDREPQERSRNGLILLGLATGLAVLSGVLGAFWLSERSVAEDLRGELGRVVAVDDVSSAGLTELNDEVRTLRFQNEELQTRLDEMSALVLELPAGRVTEIAVPFTPVFADEVVEGGRERLIAVSSDGEYAVWADGVDGSITGSGSLTGAPTGLFAATSKAWITTDAATIDVVSLLPDGEGLPTVDFGPVSFVAPEDRAYWTYESESGDVVRLKKSDGGVTASAKVPVPVVDLTIGAGSVWALGDDGRVYRINTADFTVQAIDAGADLISITAGPDALWTLSAADGSLRRVDAVSGEVLVTVPVGRDPVDAIFAGSSVWVALRSGTSLIEVDTRTAAVISRTALPGEPTALHQGDSGVFVTLEGEVPLVRVASLTLPVTGDDDDAEVADDAADAG